MSSVVWDVIIVLAIVLLSGFFSGAEMALVSLREGQARKLAQRGRRGQRAARLAQDPNRFMSAVQIGVTTATLVSGVYASATLTGVLKSGLTGARMSPALAGPLSFVLVTVGITYLSLVFGELSPKRIALQRAESVSLLAAPVLDTVALLARPVVWLLSKSTNVVVRLAGGDPSASRQVITEEELRDLVAGHQALSQDERHIVGEVFDAGKRQIREVLLPRTEVEFLAADTPVSRAAEIAASVPYSRLPVYQQSYDDVIGFVHVRDLLDPALANRSLQVSQVCRPVKFLPMSKTVLSALSEMRRERAHLAIVLDEYGGTAGIVTMEDLFEELIGDIRDEFDIEHDKPKMLRGGAVEVDGLLNLHEFAEQTGIELPEGPYETAAGYVLARLGHVPVAGQFVEGASHRITITEMDGRRIARLRVAPIGRGPAVLPASGTGASRSQGATSPSTGSASPSTGGAERASRPEHAGGAGRPGGSSRPEARDS